MYHNRAANYLTPWDNQSYDHSCRPALPDTICLDVCENPPLSLFSTRFSKILFLRKSSETSFRIHNEPESKARIDSCPVIWTRDDFFALFYSYTRKRPIKQLETISWIEICHIKFHYLNYSFEFCRLSLYQFCQSVLRKKYY